MENLIVGGILIALECLSNPVLETLRKSSTISVVKLIKQFRDRCLSESIADERIEVLIALHDAMALNDAWQAYCPDQCKQAFDLIKELFKQVQPLAPK